MRFLHKFRFLNLVFCAAYNGKSRVDSAYTYSSSDESNDFEELSRQVLVCETNFDSDSICETIENISMKRKSFERDIVNPYFLSDFNLKQIKINSLGLQAFLQELNGSLSQALFVQKLSKKLTFKCYKKALISLFMSFTEGFHSIIDHLVADFHLYRVKIEQPIPSISCNREIQRIFERVWVSLPTHEQNILQIFLEVICPCFIEDAAVLICYPILQSIKEFTSPGEDIHDMFIKVYEPILKETILTLTFRFLISLEELSRNSSQNDTFSLFKFLPQTIYEAKNRIYKSLISTFKQILNNISDEHLRSDVFSIQESILSELIKQISCLLHRLSEKTENRYENELLLTDTPQRSQTDQFDLKAYLKFTEMFKKIQLFRKKLFLLTNPEPSLTETLRPNYNDLNFLLLELKSLKKIQMLDSENSPKGLPYTGDDSKFTPILHCLFHCRFFKCYLDEISPYVDNLTLRSLNGLFELINPFKSTRFSLFEKRRANIFHFDNLIRSLGSHQPQNSFISVQFSFLNHLLLKIKPLNNRKYFSPTIPFQQTGIWLNTCKECDKIWYKPPAFQESLIRISEIDNKIVGEKLRYHFDPFMEICDLNDKECDCLDSEKSRVVENSQPNGKMQDVHKESTQTNDFSSSSISSSDSDRSKRRTSYCPSAEEKKFKFLLIKHKRFYFGETKMKIFFLYDHINMKKSPLPRKIFLRGKKHKLKAFTMRLVDDFSFACVKREDFWYLILDESVFQINDIEFFLKQGEKVQFCIYEIADEFENRMDKF